MAGQKVGRLRVAVRDAFDEPKLAQVVAFLKQRGVRVERS